MPTGKLGRPIDQLLLFMIYELFTLRRMQCRLGLAKEVAQLTLDNRPGLTLARARRIISYEL